MNFQQLLNILWSRKWIAFFTFFITVATTVVVSLILPKQYEASTSIVVDQRGVDPLTGMTLPVQLMPGYIATQVGVLTSHKVAKKVVEQLKLTEAQKLRDDFIESGGTGELADWVADLLLKNLDVKPSRESSIVEVTFTGVDPQFSALIANTFAQEFIKTNVDLRAQPAKESADWFDNQINALRERLENAQSKLSSYQQDHGIVAVDDRLDTELSRLADLSRQLVESQARTNELQSRKFQLNSTGSKDVARESLEEVLNNPLVQNLKAEVARAEAKFAELSKRIDKNHPQYQQAQAEVFSLKQKLDSETQKVLASMTSSVASSSHRDDSLAKTLASQKAKVLELKQHRDQISVLNREVENAQHAYDTAMQKSIQTRMESEMSQTNLAILNPAIPPQEASKPKLLLNVLLSVFLGSILGTGIALLMELMDRRVRSPLDLSETLSIPVLAVISK